MSREAAGTPVNLLELEALAAARLPPAIFGYFAGGADDESTLHENREAWGRIRLMPRVLVDLRGTDLSTTVLGTPIRFPVLTAPCALNSMAHPEGELAVARAVHRAGLIQIASTMSSCTLEEVAAAATAPRWFQLYCYRDAHATGELIARAEAAGYQALCVTVDIPVLGNRERDLRLGFAPPPGHGFRNLESLGMPPGSSHLHTAVAQEAGWAWETELGWKFLDWLRQQTRMPLVLKGILSPADARRAVDSGVEGIVVSNHGGRQLDTALSTCEALPDVVDAVGGRAEVYVDGGIRRGTDVLKALALGARAVLVGRPYLWGLAWNGEEGVCAALEMLRTEFARAMALMGKTRVDQLSPEDLA